MRKKIVRITESQLYDLVEQTLNEISTQTKMSAANKANLDVDDFNQKYKDTRDIRDRAMWNKRFHQSNAFRKAVNQDVDNLPSVRGTSFWPVSRATQKRLPRGDMTTHTNMVWFNDKGKINLPMLPSAERVKKFKDIEQYLNGNSYYDPNRGWVNPDDEGYDIEKSEQWAQIRQKNESMAHRVTENIMRKLREK